MTTLNGPCQAAPQALHTPLLSKQLGSLLFFCFILDGVQLQRWKVRTPTVPKEHGEILLQNHLLLNTGRETGPVCSPEEAPFTGGCPSRLESLSIRPLAPLQLINMNS